jgi:hypothetical protein
MKVAITEVFKKPLRALGEILVISLRVGPEIYRGQKQLFLNPLGGVCLR